jgi:alpha-D-ribose 1-methylphosphonate 5-triphosphate synthase subunit PhnG
MNTAEPALAPPAAAGTAARQHWMSVLARAPAERLLAASRRLAPLPAYRRLRGPETGMVMMRARTGGTGARFNLGEMSVTRCSVALEASAHGPVGHAYVAGTDARKAELAALFDALLQHPDYSERVQAELIAPAAATLEARGAQVARQAAATRVEFFTMVRGED